MRIISLLVLLFIGSTSVAHDLDKGQVKKAHIVNVGYLTGGDCQFVCKNREDWPNHFIIVHVEDSKIHLRCYIGEGYARRIEEGDSLKILVLRDNCAGVFFDETKWEN